MARVEVHAATIEGGRVASLRVKLYGLPPRTIDRDTAIAWMRDGHSMIPIVNGRAAPALQRVEVGDDGTVFIRDDNEATATDSLPDLPRSR